MKDSQNILLQSTSILSLLLWFKVIGVNVALGLKKFLSAERAPEDDVYGMTTENSEVSEKAKEDTNRAQRIVNNDGENIPYVMALTWGAVLCLLNRSSDDERFEAQKWAHVSAYAIFVVARCAHSISYWFSFPVLRTSSYMIALLASIAIAVNAVIATFD